MSGPKISIYSLTPEQRAAILAELQRKRLEQEKRESLHSELKEISLAADKNRERLSQFDLVSELSIEYEKDSSIKDSVQEIRTKLSQIIEIVASSQKTNDNTKLEKLLSSCKCSLKKTEERIDSIKSLSKDAEQRVSNSLSSQISSFFSNNETAVDVGKAKEYQDTINALDEIYNSPVLSAALKKKIDSVMERICAKEAVGDAFVQLEVFPLLKECAAFQQLWLSYGQEYRSLYSKYEAILSELGETTPIMVPLSKEAITVLKRLIAEAEDRVAKAAEQEYISKALDEIMTEMGYPLWGHREGTKRNGKHYRNMLYRYSTVTAVNVTYSDDGQISMEIGKPDSADRLPSAEETTSLVDSMNRFCTDFKKIEANLAARGIIVNNRIALFPPSGSHAQIINLNDYEMDNQETQTVDQRARRTQKKPLEMTVEKP